MGTYFKYGSRLYDATRSIFERFGDEPFSAYDIKTAGIPVSSGMIRRLKNGQIISLVGNLPHPGHSGIYRINPKYVAYLLADIALEQYQSAKREGEACIS